MRASLLWLIILGGSASALEPKQVLVIANAAMPESLDVARHYLKVRGVPEDNLLALDLPTTEVMTRPDYDDKLVKPLRARLAEFPGAIRCLLTVHGVPLKVGPQVPTADERARLDVLLPKRTMLQAKIAELEKTVPKDEAAIKALRDEDAKLGGEVYKLAHGETEAAVDSELMLVLHPAYDLYRVTPNPLYRGFPEEKAKKLAPLTLMTCRLDGPTPAVAKRLVDDAVAVETAGGLKGKAYFDARGLKYDKAKPNQHTGYEGYDESFREAAALLKDAGLDVTLDDKEPVFAKASCPDAALYGGWYSAGNFVASNTFARGAVAWHLASYELSSMRTPGTQWVANLLNSGAAVTLGPVHEPYTIAFPKPAEFFGLLATGKYTVVECYAKSTYFASWMNALIGDPLYNPYKTTGKLDEAKIIESPKGMPSLFK